MRQVAQGDSTKEIADVMQLSELTITQYVKSAIKNCVPKIALMPLAFFIKKESFFKNQEHATPF